MFELRNGLDWLLMSALDSKKCSFVLYVFVNRGLDDLKDLFQDTLF